jgi:hypothetical protein
MDTPLRQKLIRNGNEIALETSVRVPSADENALSTQWKP